MNVDRLISRATHTSGRGLLALSGIVVLSCTFNHPLENLPILSTAESLPKNMVTWGTALLLIYLLAAHILNWRNDYLTYKASFIAFLVKDFMIETGYIEAGGWKEQFPKWEEDAGAITSANLTQKIMLYGLHFALPVLMGFTAIGCLIYKPICGSV